jgi:vanillate O-demethylase ferredoxin subunit
MPSAPVPGHILVTLARSNVSVSVGPQETILEALDRIGIVVRRGCRAGTCGSCETRVLAGVPLHRDQIIDRAGPNRLSTMMVCCSRAISAELFLDL